jgi:hypothetical protein
MTNEQNELSGFLSTCMLPYLNIPRKLGVTYSFEVFANYILASMEESTLLVHPSKEPAKRTSEAGLGHTTLIFRRPTKTL